MDDEELTEYQRLAEIAARHLARYRALVEDWLADPVPDGRKLRRADAEGRMHDQALAEVRAFVERVAARRLS